MVNCVSPSIGRVFGLWAAAVIHGDRPAARAVLQGHMRGPLGLSIRTGSGCGAGSGVGG